MTSLESPPVDRRHAGARLCPAPGKRADRPPSGPVVGHHAQEGAAGIEASVGASVDCQRSLDLQRIEADRERDLGDERPALTGHFVERELDAALAAWYPDVEVAPDDPAQADEDQSRITETDQPVETPASMHGNQEGKGETGGDVDVEPAPDRAREGEPTEALAERVEPHEEEEQESGDAEPETHRPRGSKPGMSRVPNPIGSIEEVVGEAEQGDGRGDREQDGEHDLIGGDPGRSSGRRRPGGRHPRKVVAEFLAGRHRRLQNATLAMRIENPWAWE